MVKQKAGSIHCGIQNEQSVITQIEQTLGHLRRNRAARHADQIACIGRNASQQFCFYLNPIHEAAASNVQNQS
ncbi:MAG: hypothetical protein DMF00_17155 [Verrucomicrobia bacterium]|nr:MAG: hypothetical protein DMF00_17155 [Verrucomicrobiota bacterium]